ncbi:MAG: Helix-turn-helix domain [Verrucomicrobiales bacterium]|nr:Helix-turn-helix domain [Verrucomicrobiales bacterium]
MATNSSTPPKKAEVLCEEIKQALEKNEKVGEKIRAFREKLGHTPTEFSARVGVSRQSLARWENDSIKPKPATVETFPSLIPIAKPDTDRIEKLGIRLGEHVLKMEQLAKEVWIFRSETYYEALLTKFFDELVANLQKGIKFRYVFLKGSAAATSFYTLQERVKQQFEDHPNAKIEPDALLGYAITTDATAMQTGLSNLFRSSVIAVEYKSEHFQLLSRANDVFLMTPAALYTDASRKTLLETAEDVIWIELPQADVGRFWFTWKTMVRNSLKEDNSTGLELVS